MKSLNPPSLEKNLKQALRETGFQTLLYISWKTYLKKKTEKRFWNVNFRLENIKLNKTSIIIFNCIFFCVLPFLLFIILLLFLKVNKSRYSDARSLKFSSKIRLIALTNNKNSWNGTSICICSKNCN